MNFAFLFAALVLILAMFLLPLVFSSSHRDSSPPRRRTRMPRKSLRQSNQIAGPQN